MRSRSGSINWSDSCSSVPDGLVLRIAVTASRLARLWNTIRIRWTHHSFRIGVLTTEAQDGAVSNEADNLAMSSTVATWPPRDVRVGGFGPLVAVLRGGRLLVA